MMEKVDSVFHLFLIIVYIYLLSLRTVYFFVLSLQLVDFGANHPDEPEPISKGKLFSV